MQAQHMLYKWKCFQLFNVKHWVVHFIQIQPEQIKNRSVFQRFIVSSLSNANSKWSLFSAVFYRKKCNNLSQAVLFTKKHWRSFQLPGLLRGNVLDFRYCVHCTSQWQFRSEIWGGTWKSGWMESELKFQCAVFRSNLLGCLRERGNEYVSELTNFSLWQAFVKLVD